MREIADVSIHFQTSRPDLQGHVTCWGFVYMGMYVVDRLRPDDVIAATEVVD